MGPLRTIKTNWKSNVSISSYAFYLKPVINPHLCSSHGFAALMVRLAKIKGFVSIKKFSRLSLLLFFVPFLIFKAQKKRKNFIFHRPPRPRVQSPARLQIRLISVFYGLFSRFHFPHA